MKKKKKASGLADANPTIELSANYFFERALKSLDKQRYDKALKYFKKAVDYDPQNAVNYCNVAGVLSEMGNYTQANDILKKVIQDIDPKMTEVYFYMATNFANMEQFEEAENQLIHYLEEDEEGHFLEEAEELIEFLQTELPEPKKITKVKAKAGLYEHSYARELLEQGQFVEAIALLEKLVHEQPDFLAAVNNLALAYYYVGFKKEAKFYMLQVLEQDVSNLHALCNLAIYHYYESEFEELNALLPSLTKVEPFYQEHLYKLATTLGILKEHKSALKHFERLIKLGEGAKDGSIYHYAAIASLNIKAYEKAERYWQSAYQQINYEPALFYLELTSQLKQLQLTWPFTYSYFTTIEDQFELWESMFADKQSLQWSCIVKTYFYFAKGVGDAELKLNSFKRLQGHLDHDIKKHLLHYILYPLEDKEVKKAALSLLIQSRCDAQGNRKEAILDTEALTYTIAVLTEQAYVLSNIELTQLILSFIEGVAHYSTVLKGKKSCATTAAIMYKTFEQMNLKISFKRMANYYHVSAATVSKKVKSMS